jgi:hypothetical protein
MPLAEDDDVIEQLTSERSDKPLGEAVLPRRTRRDPELLEPHSDEPPVEHRAEDPIAIADDALGDHVRCHRLDQVALAIARCSFVGASPRARGSDELLFS